MIANRRKIRLSTKGLSHKEVTELQTALGANVHVESVTQLMRSPPGGSSGVGSISASLEEVHLVIALLSAATTGVAHSFLKKVGESLAATVDEWLRSKFTGKSIVPVEVILYGPDDKPLPPRRTTR